MPASKSRSLGTVESIVFSRVLFPLFNVIQLLVVNRGKRAHAFLGFFELPRLLLAHAVDFTCNLHIVSLPQRGIGYPPGISGRVPGSEVCPGNIHEI
jgi:hypothetical protein